MSRWAQLFLSALVGVALLPAAARAQFGGGFSDYMAAQGVGRQGINANGMTIVKQTPTRLRMYVQLLAKGKTLDEALAKLKERCDAAVAQLEASEADKKSIVFAGPSLSNPQSAQKRQIEMLVMQQMHSRGKKAADVQVPKSVTVSELLTVEWPLEAGTHEQRLIRTQAIEEKIKAADLAGSKDAEELSAEEQELAEEQEQLAAQYSSGENAAKPGEPHFAFIATLSNEDRQKAMAEAFVKAKENASELAKAAGVELGPLVGLSGHCSGQNSFSEDEFGGYGQSPFSMMQRLYAQQMGMTPADEQKDEVLGSEAGPLTFRCEVSAVFASGK